MLVPIDFLDKPSNPDGTATEKCQRHEGFRQSMEVLDAQSWA